MNTLNHPAVQEADFFDRIRWLSTEFKLQARRAHEAALILETMRAEQSRGGVEAARESIAKIHDQFTVLLGSLDRALQGKDATGRVIEQWRK